MNQVELPFVSVLTKCDLIKDKHELEKILDSDPKDLLFELPVYSERFRKLSEKVANVMSDFNLVNFIPLDVEDEESISAVMYQVDLCIQYGETLEVQAADEMEVD
jgi:GPN-loop GTPase